MDHRHFIRAFLCQFIHYIIGKIEILIVGKRDMFQYSVLIFLHLDKWSCYSIVLETHGCHPFLIIICAFITYVVFKTTS